jgi:hypothetical protein
MGAVKRLIHGIRTGLAPKAASIEADAEAKQRMVEAVRVQFQAPIDAASVDGAIYALKAVLDRLKATGAEIFLFQMPTSPAVDESPRTAVIRARTDAILPPALYPRFDLSALGKVDTVDGVHLIHPDAVRAAALLRSQIEKAPRGGLP